MNKKKLFFLVTVFTIVLSMLPTGIYAANGYDFKIDYTGDIIVNQEKDAKVLLVGTSGTAYTNVKIKVDVTGPAIPKIMATDSSGNVLDIAKLGYWGPAAGFPVQGDFTNTTPVKVTFSAYGTYQITLSLLDVSNADQVITTQTIQLLVLNDQQEEPPATDDPIEELPETGMKITDYLLYIVPLAIAFIVFGLVLKTKKQNE